MNDGALNVGENSRVGLPIRWIVVIAAALIALGGGVAVAQARLTSVEAKGVTTDARLSKVEDATTSHAIRDAAVEADVRNIKESVGNLDRKMDRLLEQRGVRQAGGGR